MFDLTRFKRLAAADWVENRRSYAWFLGVVVMLHFVFVVVELAGNSGFNNFTTDNQGGTFLLFLLLSAPVFAARYFQRLARPDSALLALMRPATTFEKWLLAVIVVAIAYPLAYHVVFYVCDIPATLIAEARYDAYVVLETAKGNQGKLTPHSFALFHAGSEGAGAFVQMALWLTTLQSFAMAGSLLFRNAPFLKTLLAAFLVLMAAVLLAEWSGSRPDLFYGFFADDDPLLAWQHWAFPAAWIALPALLWGSAWLALREREIAR